MVSVACDRPVVVVSDLSKWRSFRSRAQSTATAVDLLSTRFNNAAFSFSNDGDKRPISAFIRSGSFTTATYESIIFPVCCLWYDSSKFFRTKCEIRRNSLASELGLPLKFDSLGKEKRQQDLIIRVILACLNVLPGLGWDRNYGPVSHLGIARSVVSIYSLARHQIIPVPVLLTLCPCYLLELERLLKCYPL